MNQRASHLRSVVSLHSKHSNAHLKGMVHCFLLDKKQQHAASRSSCEYVKNWPYQLESSKTPSCKAHKESLLTYPKITSAWTSMVAILIFIFPRLIGLQVFTKSMLYVPTGRMENTQLLPLSANDMNMTMGS